VKREIWEKYLEGMAYKESIKLPKTVETNENFYIGKQWEGVNSNGLPTPVFNFLKRVVNFLVASTSCDRVKMNCSLVDGQDEGLERAVNQAFERAFENNDIGSLVRRMMRDAAVDGDSCLYTYWDSGAETGYRFKGELVTELLENTRVVFGNSSERRVEKQPYILISSEESKTVNVDSGDEIRRVRVRLRKFGFGKLVIRCVRGSVTVLGAVIDVGYGGKIRN